MTMRALALCGMIFLAACAGPERIVTKEVLVPVPTKPEAPDWLMVGYKPDALPVWIPPSDPTATSCLAPPGEKALRLIILDQSNRDEQWIEWAK